VDTQITESGRFERTLTVRLDESELAGAKARAARRLSKDMKIKGFRPGKAPMAMVERMVGADRLRTEAIEEAMPQAVTRIIDEEELEPATVPAITAIRDADDGGVEVDVVITLWPTLDAIPDFTGRKIQVDDPSVTDEEIDRQIDALRNQFAELEDVARPAIAEDYVLVNVDAFVGDDSIEAASANDLLYEVGSRSFIPGLDDMLIGAAAGTIAEGEGTMPEGFTEHGGEPVRLRALVKEVKVKRLPEVTDEFVSEVTEFDTEAELRARIEADIHELKLRNARAVFESRAIEEFVADLDMDLPPALVDAEAEARLRNLFARLQRDGISLEEYLRIIGQDPDSFTETIRAQAATALSTRILVEGIIAIEGLEVGDEEYRAAIEAMAAGSESSAEEIAQALEASGQKEVLTGDILRSKALERLAAAAEPVDSEGNAVDLNAATATSDDDLGEEALAATNGEE
jgi:trigger factor